MADWKTCSIRTCVGLYCCAALELQLQAGSAVEPAVVAAARSWHRDYWAVGLVAGAAIAVWYTSFVFPDLAILLALTITGIPIFPLSMHPASSIVWISPN